MQTRAILGPDRPRNAAGVQLAQPIPVTARLRVGQLVAETIEKGESLGTLQSKLRTDIGFSAKQARTIARTETATALGQGQKDAAKSQGRTEKRWITQGDALVAVECLGNEEQGWIYEEWCLD